MLPVITLVGRPNVGKSTLFNRLTRSRDALVADQPGLTRDRQYGIGQLGQSPYVIVDTGGLSDEINGVQALMTQQVQRAIDEADYLLFVTDARQNCTVADELLATELRRLGKPLTLVVNKIDHLDPDVALVDFYRLALGEPVPIAAVHGRGVQQLMNQVLTALPDTFTEQQPTAVSAGLQVAVVGRPNVGKSTLINRLLGEERLVTYDEPGTTRDSVRIPFKQNGQDYTLIDTAGVRRRAKVKEYIEKFSVIKTLQAIEQANAVILLLDAAQGIGEQDATLAGHVIESGCALVLAINKWDRLSAEQRREFKQQLERKLPFLDFATQHFISALHGRGVNKLLPAISKAYESATRKLSASMLTETLQQAMAAHSPPLVRGRRIKLRYAHQGGQNPPLIVIHGNQTEHLPDTYQRYLINQFRQAMRLHGTPIRLELKTGTNPYAGRKNQLTPRQQQKRRRLMKFVKRKD